MRHFNRESREYKFVDQFIAGLVLTGPDVKSLRLLTLPWGAAKVDFIGSYPYLVNFHIPQYQFAPDSTHHQVFERKLLLTPKEIIKLQTYRKQKYAFVPIAIFPHGRWFKLEFGVGKKMNQFDKRAKLKLKDQRRRGEKD